MRGVFYLQSYYSLLDSLLPLEKLVLKAKENDYEFVALSDDYNLYGMPTFLQLCQKHDIKPILGLKINFLWKNQTGELLVYAKNDQGIKNLIQLATASKKEAQSHLHLEQIEALGKDLFIIICGLCPFWEKIFVNDQKNEFQEVLEKLKTIFSEIFLGISFQSFFLEKLSDNLIDFSTHFEIPCLPVNKTNYDDAKAQETYQILAKMKNKTIDSEIDLSFLTKSEFDIRYQKYPQIMDSLKQLIPKINYQTPLKKNFSLPSYLDFIEKKEKDLPKEVDFEKPEKKLFQNLDAKKYLKKIVYQGLEKFLNPSKSKYEKYAQRINEELKIINDLNYENYFLIVSDLVKYAKKNNILVGPGRGSSSGSLVCFCLEITEIDPLKYNLIFERFLNPQRKTMPDIDLDFPDNKREIVIQYIRQKYGLHHVANIITFGSFAKKNAIIKELLKFKKLMPFQEKQLFHFLENQKPNQITDDLDDQIKNLLQIASFLEGLPRFTGTHPAGIILSKDNLLQNIPLQKSNHLNLLQTQWEAKELETMGLLKIDLLGLHSLTIIEQIIAAIKESQKDFNLFSIPLNDPKTYQLLSNAKTLGVFQLESGNAKKILTRMAPNNFEDLVALLALNRPGPIDSFDLFLKNRKQFNSQKIYFDSLIDHILKPTHGVILYQEQIMQIASLFAKYSLAEADLFRRAISKKDKTVLLKEKKYFLEKTQKEGHSLSLSNQIYDYILKFANYGFNKSHSVAYSLISYRMAYLKTHYFIEFMTILLNDSLNDPLQTKALLKEAFQAGITLVKPNIFVSSDQYYFKNNQLFLPLSLIKGVNSNFCKELIQERHKKNFTLSFKEFKQRLFFCLNETILTNLILGGALDQMGLNRKTLFHNQALNEVKYYRFLPNYHIVEYEEFLSHELKERQKKVFGFNLDDYIK
ncbi:DNA polymerase III subunit alpha [Candidatus Phytoplasma australiense]|uniref:DNA-directed DNA polymerase n=1 Tax=Strawberry lethal yellows phytoplasma (CPA) str. NZSb11 TaxID=980422 RepID=R4S0B8_PHYAS|nr:DNA polymerase III subunit alpha [Candidatus Phytoplasma australiense]AGL90249.1 DNA polymerase III alpha subunit [Strawberry lethal yellows phytoplasma (CPA) str. NZSb11]